MKGHEGEIVSLNFNADGDKILTGSFDGTAIVIPLKLRSGIPNQANQFMFLRAILAKFQALNSNSVDTCAVLLQLTKPVEYGMLEVENVCQFYVAILMKFLTLTSMPLELVL